jgi:hypothetical protein
MRTFVISAVTLTLTLGAALAADKTPSAAALKAADAAIANAPVTKARIVSAALPTKAALPYIGIQTTSVTTSYQVSGLPTFLAAGSGFDYDVALPLSAMLQGDAAAVSLTMTSDTYTGYCLAAYAIVPAAGGTAIGAGKSAAQGCQPGYIYAFSFPLTLPAAPGDYIVVGVSVSSAGADKLINYLHIN